MDNEKIAAATMLAKEALALLDSAGAAHAACFLQHAIDTMTDAPIPKTAEEVEAALSTPECQALMRRYGFQ